jgi:hypothetical protein
LALAASLTSDFFLRALSRKRPGAKFFSVVPMATAVVLCLANSKKLGGRCAAGLRRDGTGWVRMVSKLHNGILNAAHVFLNNGNEAALLNVLEIGFTKPKPAVHQPENWLLDGSVWKLHAKQDVQDWAAILRKAIVPGPELLRGCADRVSYAELQQQHAEASLALIAPEKLDLLLIKKPEGKLQVRGRFWLGNQTATCEYNLSMTDPIWEKKILQEGNQHLSQADRKFLVTISLGEPFND